MTFIFHPAYTQYTPYCAKAKTCPAYARASGLEPSGSALRTAAHALKALCLYCVTGGEPSPDLLLRGYSRVIGSPSGFRCLRALAIHCTPRSKSCSNWLCRAIQCRSTFSSCANPFLTLDGITRQLHPDFNAWVETLAYASGGVRKRSRRRANLEHSIPVARPTRFLSFWAAHANARRSFRGHDSKFVQMHKPLLARFGNPCDVPCRGSGIPRSPHKEKT